MHEPDYSGFLNVDKPLGLTSHDVVARVRRLYRTLTGSKKVGHAGTLDPMASGLLMLCLGRATRLSETIMAGRKVYRAEITFGRATSTYDAAGEFIASHADTSSLELSQIESALSQFIGDIQQAPPMYSAVKVQGRKLYELARQGKTIAREKRPVHIHGIEIMAWDNPLLSLDVHCGPGVYIRSLAHDMGEILGVGAHLSALRRLKSGQFDIRESVTLDYLMGAEDWQRHIISPYDALADQTQTLLNDSELARIQYGQAINRNERCDAERVFAFSTDKRLAAILIPHGDKWKPHKVFWRQV